MRQRLKPTAKMRKGAFWASMLCSIPRTSNSQGMEQPMRSLSMPQVADSPFYLGFMADNWNSFVFVHGLNGHCWETWRNADNSSSKSKWRKGAGEGVFWPVDLLPGKIENARIMTYQYESKVLCNKSTGSLSDTAGQLVRLLQEARAILGSRGPVVFVVHSLGGIVAKKASLSEDPPSHCKK